MASPRDAMITGIGLVSCLGEGPEAHWQGLSSGKPAADMATYPPYAIHKIAPLEFDKQIPKKGDQRQMEPWQRIGTYAAGLALDSAGIKGNAEVLARTDMIVAAGGGERDVAADSAILSALPSAADAAALLNEKLMSDIRPTLFLAQLHGRGRGRDRRDAHRAVPGRGGRTWLTPGARPSSPASASSPVSARDRTPIGRP